MSYKKVREIYNEVKKYDYSQRISELNMKPDRADVIIPATDIFLDIMKWSGAGEIHVPKIGLVDGMARLLYQEHIQKLALNNPS